MAFLDTSVVRISWEQFNRLYGDLVQYFRAKTSEMIDRQYYSRVRFYPLDALKGGIEKHVDVNRPIPSNFPSPNDLANGCADWLQQNPKIKESITVYDSEEDLDFDLRHLLSAFYILQHHGAAEFKSYCDKVRMPAADRRRVVFKAKVVAGKEGDANLKAKLDDLVGRVGRKAVAL